MVACSPSANSPDQSGTMWMGVDGCGGNRMGTTVGMMTDNAVRKSPDGCAYGNVDRIEGQKGG